MNQAIHYVSINKTTHDKTEIGLHDLSDVPENALQIPFSKEINKSSLLTGLKDIANFPDYFAYNWDSAFDCLTDSDIEHLMLDLREAESINTEDLNTFRAIIEDAFQDFNKPQLWIIV